MAGTRTKPERPDHAQTPSRTPGVDPIPMEAFRTLAQQLVEQDVHHRAAMPGMDPARVDLMPFSVALMNGCSAWASSTTWCVRPTPFGGGHVPPGTRLALASGVGVRLPGSAVWHHLWHASGENPNLRPWPIC